MLCWPSSHARIDGTSDADSASASSSAVIESVVTHVARFVSIGQPPSSRIDSTRNRTPSFHDRAGSLPHPGQAHDHETGQRGGLEVAAALGLHGAQQPMRHATNPASQCARNGIARGREVMPHLANRDERRQCVAHDRQPEMLKPRMRHRGQLEWKLRNQPPGHGWRLRRACPSVPGRSGWAPRTSGPCRNAGGWRNEAPQAWCRRPRAAATRWIGRWLARHPPRSRQSSTAKPTRSPSC